MRIFMLSDKSSLRRKIYVNQATQLLAMYNREDVLFIDP